MKVIRLPRHLLIGVIALTAVAGAMAAGCGGGGSDEALTAAQQEVETLRGELSSVQQDANYWQQLTSLMQPVELASMSDHRAYVLPSGVVLAVHFDNMDLRQAENLNWVAWGVPGRFCKEDEPGHRREFHANRSAHLRQLRLASHAGDGIE